MTKDHCSWCCFRCYRNRGMCEVWSKNHPFADVPGLWGVCPARKHFCWEESTDVRENQSPNALSARTSLIFSFILIFQHPMTLESRKLTNWFSGITSQLKWKRRIWPGPLYPSSTVYGLGLSGRSVSWVQQKRVMCSTVSSTHNSANMWTLLFPRQTVIAGILSGRVGGIVGIC